eukprot:17636-Heterococcus_DN1.PRE.2
MNSGISDTANAHTDQGDELRSTRKECSARATKLQKLSEEKTRASQLAVEADQLKVSGLLPPLSTCKYWHCFTVIHVCLSTVFRTVGLRYVQTSSAAQRTADSDNDPKELERVREQIEAAKVGINLWTCAACYAALQQPHLPAVTELSLLLTTAAVAVATATATATAAVMYRAGQHLGCEELHGQEAQHDWQRCEQHRCNKVCMLCAIADLALLQTLRCCRPCDAALCLHVYVLTS